MWFNFQGPTPPRKYNLVMWQDFFAAWTLVLKQKLPIVSGWISSGPYTRNFIRNWGTFLLFQRVWGASETCPNLLLKRGRSCAYRPSNGNYFQCPNVQPDSDLPWLWGGFSTVSIISNPILQGLMKLSIGDGMWWPCMSLGICIRSDSPLRSAFEWQVRWFGLVKRVTPCGSCVREVYI